MRLEISLYSRAFFAVGSASESCKNCSQDVEDSHLIFPCLSDLVALDIRRKGGRIDRQRYYTGFLRRGRENLRP